MRMMDSSAPVAVDARDDLQTYAGTVDRATACSGSELLWDDDDTLIAARDAMRRRSASSRRSLAA